MNEEQTHRMELLMQHPTGAEEWGCPVCGRRFVLQWPPAYRKVILEVGDEYAIHSASKGGITMTRASFTNQMEGDKFDEGLEVWNEAIEDLDLNWD